MFKSVNLYISNFSAVPWSPVSVLEELSWTHSSQQDPNQNQEIQENDRDVEAIVPIEFITTNC